ncbi:hypothetical protein PA598K_03658 [Paenibacillus sp. 598K]|uniref:hypothetical protein n=1 Tax=Paenibacillus sp. 598K TaxID=1117987 RepID=UPI000FF94F5F|nr:hypothetical protein [Paenibacillus sp. 598K]GBF75266.1 hypothetical protein PA598K_03658 [Paenibacillus sp. 598K]
MKIYYYYGIDGGKGGGDVTVYIKPAVSIIGDFMTLTKGSGNKSTESYQVDPNGLITNVTYKS